MTLNYYPRPHSSTSHCTIYLRISIGRGCQFRLQTDVKLESMKQWNDSSKRVRARAGIPHEQLNSHLDGFKSHMLAEILRMKASGAELQQELLNRLAKAYFYPERHQVLMDSDSHVVCDLGKAFKLYLDRLREGTNPATSKTSRPSTIQSLEGTLKHLEHLRLHKTKTSELDLDWHGNFIAKSELGGKAGKPLSLNYIGKHVKNVKTVLRYVSQRGWEVHTAHQTREFRVPQESGDGIYLTLPEIHQILEVPETSLSPSEILSRQLFIIGCFSGLRVSDYKRLSTINLIEHDGILMFELHSEKTDSHLIIPVHPVIKNLIDENAGRPPSRQSDVLINRNMKRIGQLAGLEEIVRMSRTIGGKRQTTIHKKFELITTHTARRSFATNAYLSGMDTLDIMSITGHTKESTFLRYIKVTPRERAKRMALQAFFQT